MNVPSGTDCFYRLHEAPPRSPTHTVGFSIGAISAMKEDGETPTIWHHKCCSKIKALRTRERGHSRGQCVPELRAERLCLQLITCIYCTQAISFSFFPPYCLPFFSFLLSFSFFFFSLLFRATGAAYKVSQARSQIGAATASHVTATTTATWDPSHICNL